MKLHAPAPLSPEHHVNLFSCGESVIDDWLKRRTLLNQSNGASRTFVVTGNDQQVLGYYALAAGAATRQDATRAIRQNMPDPIPVMVLARLAVNIRAQGLKLGASLLKDAVSRCVQISSNTGVRAMLVHALNERAREFYEYYGFKASPINPMTLMLRIGPA
jgi:predicted GNAT family N-acyltransferase